MFGKGNGIRYICRFCFDARILLFGDLTRSPVISTREFEQAGHLRISISVHPQLRCLDIPPLSYKGPCFDQTRRHV